MVSAEGSLHILSFDPHTPAGGLHWHGYCHVLSPPRVTRGEPSFNPLEGALLSPCDQLGVRPTPHFFFFEGCWGLDPGLCTELPPQPFIF